MVRGICKLCHTRVKSGQLYIDEDGLPICSSCENERREKVSK